MDDLYRIITLKYLYSLLDLKKYEKILEDNNIESIMEDNSEFKYFSLLSEGDISSFSEEEQKEFLSYSNYSIEDVLCNDELLYKMINFIKKTYNKYYFSDLKGEYIYYNGTDEEHMVPDDAFAIGINYRVNYKEEEDFDKKREQVDDIIIDIINNIQSNDSNIKIAVIENNGMKLNNDFLLY